MLRGSLIVGRSPRSDALETEDVVAPIEHSELSAGCKHLLKADLALSIIFSIIRAHLSRWLVTNFVCEATRSPILATVGLVEHTHAFLWLWLVTLEEFAYSRIILITVLPLVELVRAHVLANLSGSNRLDHTDFTRHWVVTQDNPLSYLTFRELVIVLKHVRVIPLRRLHLSHHWPRHSWHLVSHRYLVKRHLLRVERWLLELSSQVLYP